MKKLNFSILVSILVSQSAAWARLNFDKRCTKEIPYLSLWAERKATYVGAKGMNVHPFELPNGDIIIGGDDKKFRVVDKNLKHKDSHNVDSWISNGFEMYDKDTAITATNDGEIIRYNQKSGFSSGGRLGQDIYAVIPARLSDGTIVFGSSNGVAIFKKGATTLVPLAAPCRSVAVMNDDTFVVGCDDGKVNYLSSTGELLHSFSTGSTGDYIGFRSPMILPNGNVAIGSSDGYFYILSPEAKLISKSQLFGPFYSDPNLVDENIIVTGNYHGYVLFLDARTLAEKARFPKQGKLGAIYSGISIVTTKWGKKLIVAASEDNNIYFLSVSGELVTKVSVDGLVYANTLVTAAGDVFAVDRPGKAYLIELKSEKQSRKVISADCTGGNSSSESEETTEEEPKKAEEAIPQAPKNQDRFD